MVLFCRTALAVRKFRVRHRWRFSARRRIDCVLTVNPVDLTDPGEISCDLYIHDIAPTKTNGQIMTIGAGGVYRVAENFALGLESHGRVIDDPRII